MILHNLAWLLLALCYRDLGQRATMWTALAKARDLRHECLLLLFVHGLCLTEDLPLTSEYDWPQAAEQRAEARQILERALLKLSDARAESAIAAVVVCGVPLTRRFVDDTYAYLLLKIGALTCLGSSDHSLLENGAS